MIGHNRPTLGDAEQAAAARVLASGWVAQGPEVEAFEREFCAFLGMPQGHAVAVSSGSAALFLALVALGSKGKRVALPVYACSAVSNAIALVGAIPEFVDVAPDSPNADAGALAATRAEIAIAAHMFGIPITLDQGGRQLVIEDCAQALGAQVQGTPIGLAGHIGIFSFFATKMITSGGQGGMVVSRDRALIDGVRDYRQFDQRHDRIPRFNLQMTDIQAAIGRVQLSRLAEFLARRAEIFSRYRAAGLPLLDGTAAATPARYRVILRNNAPRTLIDHLAARGVTAIVPVEDWELLDAAKAYPRALHLSRSTISLPIYPTLGNDDVDRIIEAALAAVR